MSADDERKGSIYFLIRGRRIKVGFSIDVQSRMRSFQHTTDDLLAVMPNVTMADEKAAHKYLWRWHVVGEWFEATPECLDAVQELIDGALDQYSEHVRQVGRSQRRLAAQIAANESWAQTLDRSARTAPARRAMEDKFLTAADGDPLRAESLKRAHYQRLALKSAQVRAAKRRGWAS